MSDLRAVAVDLDGTLADSERYGHRIAFNLAFERMGLPDTWSEDLYGELLSIPGGKERLRHHLSGRGVPDDELDELVPQLHAHKNRAFLELAGRGRIPARPGAARLIDELEAAAIPIALATTGSREWVVPLTDSLFGPRRFKVVVTGDEVAVKKPDPAAYEIALDRLGVNAVDVVAIEDSPQGLAAAHAAGLPCVIVVNDYTKSYDYSEAELVLEGFGEPGAPSACLSDPLGTGYDGMLTLETLARIRALARPSLASKGK